MVSMPLVLDGRPVGLIDVFDKRPRDWSERLDFIRNVGRLLAGAFEKAVLLDQLEAGNRDLRLLVDSSLEFGSTLDHEAVLAHGRGARSRRLRRSLLRHLQHRG